jgi:hypothetical protein
MGRTIPDLREDAVSRRDQSEKKWERGADPERVITFRIDVGVSPI